jgi:hypothetical protein
MAIVSLPPRTRGSTESRCPSWDVGPVGTRHETAAPSFVLRERTRRGIFSPMETRYLWYLYSHPNTSLCLECLEKLTEKQP